jgi:hypothetical protein
MGRKKEESMQSGEFPQQIGKGGTFVNVSW